MIGMHVMRMMGPKSTAPALAAAALALVGFAGCRSEPTTTTSADATTTQSSSRPTRRMTPDELVPPAANEPHAAADEATAAPEDASDPPIPDLPDLTEIERSLTEIRGLEFIRPVPSERQSMEAWGDYVQAELDQMLPPDRRDGIQAGLVRLGLLQRTMDLSGEFKNALLTQAGAYYDPKTGTFYYLMADVPPAALETIASHELVHALQDQHFDLAEFVEAFESHSDSGPRNDDALLAMRFLVEGEATYVQMLWQMQTMMGVDLTANPAMESMTFKMMADMDLDQLVQMAEGQADLFGDFGDSAIGDAMRAMDQIPPYILEPLNAAYMKGAYFVMSARQNGGWDAVAEAYRGLPKSTEQTLHPERFLDARDDPTVFDLPAIVTLDGAGWTTIDEAVHGEFYLDLLLRVLSLPRATADTATRGWDGDVYRAYRGPGGQVLVVLATTWDTPADAAEFFEAYAWILPKRYPGFVRMSPDDGSEDLVFDTGDVGLGTGRLVRRGREVFLVEGGPRPLVEPAVDELLGMEIPHVE